MRRPSIILLWSFIVTLVVWGALVAGFAAKRVADDRKRAQKGAALTEANASTISWKASVADGRHAASRGSATSASGASGSNGAAEMEMGAR